MIDMNKAATNTLIFKLIMNPPLLNPTKVYHKTGQKYTKNLLL